ncbi:hypothetical protein KHQ82_10470 [Mycoplasmatota bacterium]|nr:hypothetical protein KHQ82_10470 [Mycoplasmatota bacterium]
MIYLNSIYRKDIEISMLKYIALICLRILEKVEEFLTNEGFNGSVLISVKDDGYLLILITNINERSLFGKVMSGAQEIILNTLQIKKFIF